MPIALDTKNKLIGIALNTFPEELDILLIVLVSEGTIPPEVAYQARIGWANLMEQGRDEN